MAFASEFSFHPRKAILLINISDYNSAMANTFRIFTNHSGTLHAQYKVRCTADDLYINDLLSDAHFSYHASGISHHRDPISNRLPEMRVEKQRPKLKEFAGAETILTRNILLDCKPVPTQKLPGQQDIVLMAEPPFAIEISIASEAQVILPLPDRQTISYACKLDSWPIVYVETYKIIDRTLSMPRFTMTHPFKFGDDPEPFRRPIADSNK